MARGYELSFFPVRGGMRFVYWDNLHGNDYAVTITKKGKILSGKKEITAKEFCEKIASICNCDLEAPHD
jgi:hypothetical protein